MGTGQIRYSILTALFATAILATPVAHAKNEPLKGRQLAPEWARFLAEERVRQSALYLAQLSNKTANNATRIINTERNDHPDSTEVLENDG
jgi:hypothetical protein